MTDRVIQLLWTWPSNRMQYPPTTIAWVGLLKQVSAKFSIYKSNRFFLLTPNLWCRTEVTIEAAFSQALWHYQKQRGRDNSRPLSWPSVVRLSTVRVIALSAIHRSVLARLERYFSVDATGGTHSRIHLPTGAKAPLSASAFLLLCCTAVRTTLGIVSEAFTSEELLFISTKGKGSPTINTLQFPVGETHWMISFLKNCELNFGHPITWRNLPWRDLRCDVWEW